MFGKCTHLGVTFYWQVYLADVGPKPTCWTLEIAVGDFSVARRYSASIDEAEAAEETLRVAPQILLLMEKWMSVERPFC
jgi:hypothetical protein